MSFRGKKPDLSHDATYRLTNISLQIIKCMNPLYAVADARERSGLVQEYKTVLATYLESRLHV